MRKIKLVCYIYISLGLIKIVYSIGLLLLYFFNPSRAVRLPIDSLIFLVLLGVILFLGVYFLKTSDSISKRINYHSCKVAAVLLTIFYFPLGYYCLLVLKDPDVKKEFES